MPFAGESKAEEEKPKSFIFPKWISKFAGSAIVMAGEYAGTKTDVLSMMTSLLF